MAPSLLQTVQNATVSFVVGLPDPVVTLLAGRPEMIDGQTLDPQIQLLLKLIAAAGLPRVETLSPSDARALFRESAGLLSAGAEMASVLERRVPGPGGEIPLRIYVPRGGSAPHPLLVYFHGGGWSIGDLDTHDLPCRAFAERAQCIVVSVDYRLGPEHKFPAALDDAMAAFAWVAAHAGELGGDPSRIAVGGDSAGGNLAASLCQQTMAAGLRTPDFQLLIYPVTDLAAESESYELFAEGFYLTRPLMRWFRANYLVDDDQGFDPRASPVRAGNLGGLPPAFVMTAGFDVLRDEGKSYAQRLLDAGVDVEYRNYDSLIHGFVSMAGVVREAATAFGDAAEALKLAFGETGGRP